MSDDLRIVLVMAFSIWMAVTMARCAEGAGYDEGEKGWTFWRWPLLGVLALASMLGFAWSMLRR